MIEPLSRELLDYVQRIQPNENLFGYLRDRKNVRQMTGTGLKPAYTEPTDSLVRDVRHHLSLIGFFLYLSLLGI